MKSGPFTHTIAALLSSVSACFAPSAPAQVPTNKVQLSKKQNRLTEDVLFKVDPVGYTPPGRFRKSNEGRRALPVENGYRHHRRSGLAKILPRIIPCRTTPVAGTQPGRKTTAATTIRGRRARHDYIPVNFTPRQNPFYRALPYNDKAREGHRPEAPKVVPWFKRGVSRTRHFRLQRPLGGDPQRQPNSLRPMGGRRSVSHRSLGIRLRQRAAQTEPQPRRRTRCFAGRSRLPWPAGDRCDRLEIRRVLPKFRPVRGQGSATTTPSSSTSAKRSNSSSRRKKRVPLSFVRRLAHRGLSGESCR